MTRPGYSALFAVTSTPVGEGGVRTFLTLGYGAARPTAFTRVAVVAQVEDGKGIPSGVPRTTQSWGKVGQENAKPADSAVTGFASVGVGLPV